MNSHISDDTLLIDLKHNDRNAFNHLFGYYYPRLMAYVSAMMDEAVAEDITQDVFLYVWENRHKLYIGNGFHSYLFQSAYTRCLDYIRRNKYSEKYRITYFQDYLDEYASLLQENHILEELYTGDFYCRLYQLLDKIPPQRREVFLLAYIHGKKAKEIAESLNMSQRTVESHIYLTIKYLKKRMSKEEFYALILLTGFSFANMF